MIECQHCHRRHSRRWACDELIDAARPRGCAAGNHAFAWSSSMTWLTNPPASTPCTYCGVPYGDVMEQAS